jgi:hypothetical protein
VAYRRRYRQGIAMKWEMPDGDGYGGADLGSLAHWALTEWDMDPAALGALLPEGEAAASSSARTLPAHLRPIFSSAKARAVLRSWLGQFAMTSECELLREIKARGDLRQELAFSTRHGNIRLVGSIDVYWEDSDGCHVRDWKITPVESAPFELYERQALFYALACRTARPGHDVDAGLIYIRPDGNGGAGKNGESRTFRVLGWKALEDDVTASAELAASGPFEPRLGRIGRLSRCPACPFRRSCGL